MTTTATESSLPDQRSVGAVLSGLNHLSLWRGRIVVIKYGGAAMGRAGTWCAFAPRASIPSSSTVEGPRSTPSCGASARPRASSTASA